MRILVLGAGRQGRAALYDLALREEVQEVVAADRDPAGLTSFLADRPWRNKVRCEEADAADPRDLSRLMAMRPDAVIDLLPVPLHPLVTRLAVQHSIHLVSASYADEEMDRLDETAKERGIAILPEFGLDPGIDLVLLGEATRRMDKVCEVISYGAGFPELSAANNAIRYKTTWNFEGVLRSYYRPARVIQKGQVLEIKKDELFHPRHLHEVEIEGLGRLEAFPNGDALKTAAALGLKPHRIERMGRYVLRWPGHGEFWRRVAELGLLEEDPIQVDGCSVDRRRFLAAALEPRLQYGQGERDVAVARVEVKGDWKGRRVLHLLQMVDRKDLATGFSAMSRTVGFTAAIGAVMIVAGQITRRGLLSPLRDVPFPAFALELSKRGMEIDSKILELGPS